MKILLASHSKNAQVTHALLENIAACIEEQLNVHYAALWQSAGLSVETSATNTLIAGDSPLIVFDDADQAGALGYHDITPEGLAYGKIFLNPILKSGGTLLRGANSLSVTISHEALEMVRDPYVNAWFDMPDGATEDACELCDRTESDAYEIEGVSVSNFLGPRAFRDGAGPYDWMRLLKNPWEIRPGGYAIRRTGGPSGKYDTVWGKEYPEWKKETKKHPASRTAKRQRKLP